ncbi:hypothetical protein KIH74_07430 [Kineosporia sp. J2-2]|uniref:Uncharacterized protein n=1 Tax=Kineosporia corallincola TaxID=2835133 RepID=A0ABS5TCF0_9ACTN|nr:DUF6308 family protein [Kineosporia corallincola]MBT0768752.1 hypothetical protein [Kineosporia corallincola]
MATTLTMPWPLRAGYEPVAAGLLKTYFGIGEAGIPPWTGASFETIGGPDPDPDRFTALDLVAVGLLSVTVPPPAMIAILEPDAAVLANLLRRIPRTLSLVDADDDLVEGDNSPLVRLWQRLREYPDVGRTVTSKLMARKRPRLVPVYDSVIAREFGLRDSGGYWWGMREQLRADDRDLWRRITRLISGCGLEQQVTALRAVDVVVWMHGRDQNRSARLAVDAGLQVPGQRGAVD